MSCPRSSDQGYATATGVCPLCCDDHCPAGRTWVIAQERAGAPVRCASRAGIRNDTAPPSGVRTALPHGSKRRGHLLGEVPPPLVRDACEQMATAL